mgnify:CR=1 FL=1
MKTTIYLGLTLLSLGALTACGDDDYGTPSLNRPGFTGDSQV